MSIEETTSFARRYRPTGIEGYIGNSDVKRTVWGYLKNGRPQAMLLSGASGCGKTTLARIIAREYCCENRDSEKGACGECPSCLAFEEYIKTGAVGDLADIYEIDASKAGKNDIDSMLDNMEYPPMSFDWKVYIVDECHLLSQAGMGRLLKSLEEPPEGVLIILCTTDPDKLLDTIRNRCQIKCQITKPSTQDICALLKKVCLMEGKPHDLAGLRMLAVFSDNVVRDSLNNLEEVLTVQGSAESGAVSTQFKQVSDKIIFNFYKAYIEKDYVEYSNIMYQIKTKYNFNQFINTLTAFTTRGLYILNSVEVDSVSATEMESYLKLFKRFSPAEISNILNSLKTMATGDIETNLLSFIYRSNSVEEVKTPVIKEEDLTIEDERLMRNSNLKAIENSKLHEGSKSIKSELTEIGISEMGSFFNLEKVE